MVNTFLLEQVVVSFPIKLARMLTTVLLFLAHNSTAVSMSLELTDW